MNVLRLLIGCAVPAKGRERTAGAGVLPAARTGGSVQAPNTRVIPCHARRDAVPGALARRAVSARRELMLARGLPKLGILAITTPTIPPIEIHKPKKREYVLAFAECGNRSQAAEVGGTPRGAGRRATRGPRLGQRQHVLSLP
jgi:hypothetical protein